MNSSSQTSILFKSALVFAAFIQVALRPANAVTPKDFGGKGDVVILHDVDVNGGSTSLRSASGRFTQADLGKAVIVNGAADEGGALITRIQKVVSEKEVVLTEVATSNVARGTAYYGTDDTKAIRSCVYEGTTKGGECTISDGVTFMVSNPKSTIALIDAGNNPIQRGVIGGLGTIIFAPQGSLVSNDRLFYVTSREARPMPISGPIALGEKSFKAQAAADAATLSPGDWVIITEMDSVAGDVVYADWMEVTGVSGVTVTTAKPFRMAFPNARPYEGPPKHWGLTFRKVGPITSNVKIQNITIIVPKIVQEKRKVVGIDTRDTRGTVISNVKCQDASGNCFAGYMDQGLMFLDNYINGTVYSEFAAQVDATISRNHVNEQGKELSLPGPPVTGGLEVDFGTGFSVVQSNVVGPTRQVCLMMVPGVHDTDVSGNTCDLVTFGTGAACVLARGGYRLTITKNSCRGGTGASRGIDVGDAPNLKASILSDKNIVRNNRVQGFATQYSCSGSRLRTDSCDYGR